eukprot:4613943-Amphidinium_carterae.1
MDLLKSSAPRPPGPCRRAQKSFATRFVLSPISGRCSSSARRELQDSSLPIWQRFADWLLGEDVYATQFKSTNADFIHRPAWKQLLAYEFQVRKDFSKRFNEGSSIATALLRATENQAVFIKYFTTPTCLAAGAAAAASSSSGLNSSRRSRSPRRAVPAGVKPAASVKGKGKGAAKRWRAGLSNFTPDGKPNFKCFKFQRGQCNLPDCPRAHFTSASATLPAPVKPAAGPPVQAENRGHVAASTKLRLKLLTTPSAGDENQGEQDSSPLPPTDEEALLEADKRRRVAKKVSHAAFIAPDTGGVGTPLLVGKKAFARQFVDGGGLCSPGCWPPDKRRLKDGIAAWLRERILRT